MLHVGRFVHADGQLDPQVRVRTVLGDRHAVELWLLGSVGGRVQDHLIGNITATLHWGHYNTLR